VFPDATASEVEPVVHRVVATLSESVRSGDVPAFTISVGLSDSGTASGHAEAIRQADEAMFRAKQAGRDRVVRTTAAPQLHAATTEGAHGDRGEPTSVRSVHPVAGN
jgi:PleD family two-component response regulator